MLKLRNTLVVALLTLAGLTACNGESSRTAQSDAAVSRVGVPFREHGYRNLHPMILSSEESLGGLLQEVEGQDGWNDKQAFTAALATLDIDFTDANLILFRMTEGSGSIQLNPATPVVDEHGVNVAIERIVPDGGTGDMAYYALLYSLDKSVDQINFTKGSQAYHFFNRPGSSVFPVNCAVWFDGCNSCSISTDGTAACDQRFCAVYDDSRCTQWRDEIQDE